MENVQLLPENEVKEFEGRTYLNPQVGIDETNTFIDKFRDTQRGNNQEIATQTQMLGTDVPSNLGGLTGVGNYFTSRYQTPQTNVVTQNLRAAAQADALNQMLKDEQAVWKKRQQDAYRAQQRRAYNRAYGSGSGGGTSGGGSNDNTSGWDGETEDVPTDLTAVESFTLSSDTPGDTGPGIRWVPNMASVGTGRMSYYRIDENKDTKDPEYMTLYEQQEDGTLVRAR